MSVCKLRSSSGQAWSSCKKVLVFTVPTFTIVEHCRVMLNVKVINHFHSCCGTHGEGNGKRHVKGGHEIVIDDVPPLEEKIVCMHGGWAI